MGWTGVRAQLAAVGLIGAGSLADALAGGLLAAGLAPDRMWVCNRADDGRLERFRQAGLKTTRDKAEVAAAAEMLVLLVKPKDAAAALADLRDLVRPAHRLLSCMAGISTAYIEGALGGRPRVLRAMPNIGSAIRASATALCAGRFADEDDLAAARSLLGAVGEVIRVDEGAMDAVTAVAGSGPAYVYYLMEAMAEAAAALGLPEPEARRLILQTVAGAARLAVESERPPAELRAAVSSPGGTTVAGVAVLDAAGVRRALVAAVRRAAQRSRELGLEWER
jgi:pyrroline-5-carboxylate reductase